jgi:hypothetical protein
MLINSMWLQATSIDLGAGQQLPWIVNSGGARRIGYYAQHSQMEQYRTSAMEGEFAGNVASFYGDE